MVGNPSNWVAPRAARELQPAWDLDATALNGGQLGPEYVMSQVGRMRGTFFLVGGGEGALRTELSHSTSMS
jgi:hypothetical protein